MKTFLLVALGGALGSVTRHGINMLALRNLAPDFPYGTLIVNVAGSFLIGLIAGLLAENSAASPEMRSFVVIGVLGGFTTFSAFSLDIVTLSSRGDYLLAIVYLGLSIILSLAFLVAGLFAMRAILAG